VLAFNRPAIEERMERVAAYLGLPGESYDSVLKWLLELRAVLGIPHRALELGLKEERIDALAEMAAVDPTAAGNPVPVDAAALAGLYRAALEGTLPVA
jgi:alcohol dehydrogenase class IV